ncbi:ABC transporter permease [Streptacidiphilus griseoplanus]|uniref:ABC transporter permease n=1 Tax=Peterkaempfera griseoplana TaxID=66896 RepID=UPI0006E34906|nr:FtsX-like permease family protein [Peterkaempfera griseoplana]
MSAVWPVARAAVRRRRLQTFVIGLVVLFSTAAIVVSLGLLDASASPFDHAFARQRGAHVVATFDSASVSPSQLAETAGRPGVAAAAGPFRQAVVTVAKSARDSAAGRLTVVGRADPGGSVDRLTLTAGRWATRPGEIVVNQRAGRGGLGATLRLPGGPQLRVVGYASSVSGSADAWVSPDQIEALHPTAAQMLYRFTDAGTGARLRADLAGVTRGLPADSLIASQNYLTIRAAFAAGPGAYVPFLVVFGFLGVSVAVLIVANVISGAVVSGFRHIGILKSLGFTPRQVTAVYLVMVAVPAVVGCALGALLGDLAARPLLTNAFKGVTFGLGNVGVDLGNVGVSLWVVVVALLGMPAVVLLAALVPALRARGLSAANAISAGSAPRTGRGLRVQRWLGGTRLPRSVSLGLGLPCTRPGRTGLTLAAILLGVTTVTFAGGLATTVTRFGSATGLDGAFQVTVQPGEHRFGQVEPKLGDAGREALLRSLPGARYVTADQHVELSVAGYPQSVVVDFLRGDSSTLRFQDQLVEGRWLGGPGEIVVASKFLHQAGLKVGDHLTLKAGSKQTRVTVVGEIMTGAPSYLYTDWKTLAPLSPDYRDLDTLFQYQVQLTPGTDAGAYAAAVRRADPGLYTTTDFGTNTFVVTVLSLSTVLTLMLGTVAALGVFNTVVLTTRERRRDLGMLKSIGMTPRQVVVMMVTSMAALGVVGGLLGIPLGIAAHRLMVPLAARTADVDIARSLTDVWQAPVLTLLALAGVVIAVLGAYVPARSAARLTIARVLHNE